MSTNIKTKQSQKLHSDPRLAQSLTVGNTIGERKALKSMAPSRPFATVKGQSERAIDNFSRAASKATDLSKFAPDASFEARRTPYSSGKPLQRFLHGKMEAGEAPYIGDTVARPLKDDHLLKICDTILSKPEVFGSQLNVMKAFKAEAGVKRNRE